jgi:hypothetical protein
MNENRDARRRREEGFSPPFLKPLSRPAARPDQRLRDIHTDRFVVMMR